MKNLVATPLQACQEVAADCYRIVETGDEATCVFCGEPYGTDHDPDCTMKIVLDAIAAAEEPA